MNKQAKLEIETTLKRLQDDLRYKARMNKYAFKKLTEDQTSIKRQIAEYTRLIKTIGITK